MNDPTIIAAFIAATASLAVAVSGAVFTYFSTRKNQRDLAHLEASLNKIERLQASRSAGYEDIWNLTGSLNLFGPTTKPDIKDLSARLKDWYFQHGMVLGTDSKKRYFLVQEILNFGMLHSASFRRPADERLFGDRKHPLQVLRDLRSQYLGVTDHGGEVGKLEAYVSAWKVKNNQRKEQAEENWVLLQFMMSKFRSGLIKDLGFDGEDVQDTE